MIFIDTGAWFAAVVPSDPMHATVARWFAENRRPLVTSDCIVDETLTLLRVRGERSRALAMGRFFFESEAVRCHYVSASEVLEAWRIFARFADKGWSFTDCTSRVLIERFAIQEAVALDEHFKQFGNVLVLP